MLRFPDGLVWKVGQTIEIKLRFEIIFFAIPYSSTINQYGDFRKHFSNRKNLKTPAFLKNELYENVDNHEFFLTEFYSKTEPQ